MADISKITLPNGSVYNIKDAYARQEIENIQTAISGGVMFMGETTTALSDGATTSTITINGNSVAAVKGYLVVYNSKELVFDGTKWIELGDLSLIGDLGWKDSASTEYTPAGTVSKPTFTGTPANVTFTISEDANGNYEPKGTVSTPSFTGSNSTFNGKFTPSGSVGFTNTNKTAAVTSTAGTATYTPSGDVSAPSISMKSAGSTTTVNSITAVGSLPTFSTTVTDENLAFSWNAGALPTKGANTTVKTGDASYEASAPTFSGTGVHLVTGNIAVPTSATFSGEEGDVSVSGTPNGSVSQPTFSGIKAKIEGSVTASGDVSKPTFSGTKATITVK